MKKIKQNSLNLNDSLLASDIQIDEQNLNKKQCFNIKCIIIILISVIILLLGTSITLLILYLKILKNQNNNSLKICEAKVKDLELLIETLSNRISILEKENLECNNNLNDYKTKYETCEVKVNDLESTIETLSNRISVLEKENLECKNNLNDYITKYENLEVEYNNLNTNYNNLKKDYDKCINDYNNLNTKYGQCLNDYSICIVDYNSCKNQLEEWIEFCKYHYNDLTNEMKSDINLLVVDSYYKYSSYGERAKYISEEMGKKYNKHNWSCFISNNYGSLIWHIKNMYYKYTFNNLDYTIFIGAN